MLRSPHAAARANPSYRAVRELYRSFLHESSPEGRGQALLRRWLMPDQRKLFDAHGYVDVTGCYSGRRYRIYYGVMSNIRELDAHGEPRAGLCLVATESLPPGDIMLAQKIALETDERAALAAANYFPSASRPPYRSWRRS
jgi:hypothetical protein